MKCKHTLMDIWQNKTKGFCIDCHEFVKYGEKL